MQLKNTLNRSCLICEDAEGQRTFEQLGDDYHPDRLLVGNWYLDDGTPVLVIHPLLTRQLDLDPEEVSNWRNDIADVPPYEGSQTYRIEYADGPWIPSTPEPQEVPMGQPWR